MGCHPAVDESAEQCVVFATPSPTVRFTEPFASFVGEAVRRGVRPVLVTRTDACVSPFVSSVMRRAAGAWVLQARDGTLYDALSGWRVEGLDQWGWPSAWQGQAVDGPVGAGRERLPGFADPSDASCPVVTFDVDVHQRAEPSSRVGAVASSVGAALGVSWQCWATREPLLAEWDVEAVTETVRRGMPDSPTVRAVAAGGAFCEVQASRTGTGLAEHTVGGVPVDRGTDLLAMATAAAERVVAEHNPAMGFFGVADFDLTDVGVVHSPRARVSQSPLVMLVGPRAVRDLGLDVERLVGEHDVRVLGRARVPCLLARFDGADPVRRWQQAVAFTVALGLPDALDAVGGRPTQTEGQTRTGETA